MPNIVKTVFEVDATKAFAQADLLKAKYADLDKLTFTQGLDRALGKANELKKVLETPSTLGIGNSAFFNTVNKGAELAKTQVVTLQDQIRKLRQEASKTTDPALLTKINEKVKTSILELDRLDAKIGNVLAGRQAGQVRKAYNSQVGQALNAGVMAQVPYAYEAAQGFELAAANGLAITGTMIGLLGAGAVAIGATKLITDEIAASALKRLKTEEKLAIEYGRQQTILKNIRDEQAAFERGRGFTAKENAFVKDATNSSPEYKAQQRALLEKRLQQQVLFAGPAALLDPNGVQGRNEEIASTRKLLTTLDDLNANSFDVRKKQIEDFEAFKRQVSQSNVQRLQKEAADAGKDVPALQAIIKKANDQTGINPEDKKSFTKGLKDQITELVKEGTEKVKDFTQKIKGVFDDLRRSGAKDNPIASLLIEADSKMTVLRENTKGLNKDLRRTFEDLLRQQNSLALFEAKVDSNLGALELRQQAKNIRAFTDTSQQDNLRFLLELEKRRPSGNLRDIAPNLGNPGLGGLGNPGLGGTQNPGFAIFDQQNEAFQRFVRENQPKQTVNERVDAQLKLLQESGAKTEGEKAIIDKKIIALTQLDPGSLSSDQRNVAAAAREREAARVENYERAALQTAADHLRVSEAIRDQNAELLAIAQKQGIKGVDAVITVKDETETGIRTVKQERPTQESTKNLYGGFGLAGGTNQ